MSTSALSPAASPLTLVDRGVNAAGSVGGHAETKL